MGKPKKERNVLYPPKVGYFKPQGIPLFQLEQIVLNIDEYEAVRLVDYEGLDQEHAARSLGISRPTCARIVEVAHRKIAEAITQGKAIRIEGGSFILMRNLLRCGNCGQTWESDAGGSSGDSAAKKPASRPCPKCSGTRVIDLGRAAGAHRHGQGWRSESGGRGRNQRGKS